MLPDSIYETAQSLQNLLVARARGEPASTKDYTELRGALVADPTASRLLPSFVRTCRDLGQFWGFIKKRFRSYAERTDFIWAEFQPLLDHLEQDKEMPAESAISDLLGTLDEAHVHEVWTRALDRRASDPEGAITLARTLLESTCKTILDKEDIGYNDTADLPKLYKHVAEHLKLGPSQHGEQVFKQILGGCWSVVEGLGSLRNQLGDAHGKGRRPVRPSARHAELAVNLAGSMATFLVATWKAR